MQSMATRDDVAQVREGLALLRKDMELMYNRLIIRMGSMFVVGFGLMLAALRYLPD
jgi:hypothetical protein